MYVGRNFQGERGEGFKLLGCLDIFPQKPHKKFSIKVSVFTSKTPMCIERNFIKTGVDGDFGIFFFHLHVFPINNSDVNKIGFKSLLQFYIFKENQEEIEGLIFCNSSKKIIFSDETKGDGIMLCILL